MFTKDDIHSDFAHDMHRFLKHDVSVEFPELPKIHIGIKVADDKENLVFVIFSEQPLSEEQKQRLVKRINEKFFAFEIGGEDEVIKAFNW